MSTRLLDLREITHLCTKESSQKYIEEAIICYESGAIRSSIVSTWIAVFTDLIEKIRDLSISGDAISEKLFGKYEKSIRENDTRTFLDIERTILDEAFSQLQLISASEQLELRRIQEDRHRCAHPTVDGHGANFDPPAELARTHIVSAVNNLLKYPPTQGKAALEDILSIVCSKHFPTDRAKAEVSLRHSGLSRPRQSLLRNAVIVFLKRAFSPNAGESAYCFKTALLSTLAMHRRDTIDIISNEISPIARKVSDENLHNVISTICDLSEIWPEIEEDVWIRLESYCQRMPSFYLENIDEAIKVPRLAESCEFRVNYADISDLNSGLWFDFPDIVRNRIIDILSESKSYDRSNEVCLLIEQYIFSFKRSDWEKISEISLRNDQVSGSFIFKRIKNQFEEKYPPDRLET